MEQNRKKMRLQKAVLSLLSLIFLAMALAGIGAMYYNGGYGKGISWVYEDSYEDSDTFCLKLGEDIRNIFTYIGYKDLFETNGQLGMSKPVVRLTDGPGVDEDWTLDQIVRYARVRGYYLGDNFTVQGSPMSMDDDDMEVTVQFLNPSLDFLSTGQMETRMTKEELALDVLECLGQYYSIYYNFMEHETNVRFRVVYKSDEGVETVYTNVPDMTLDELRGFGKYLFIPGNTIRMDTNLAVIPEDVAALLETWNPNNNDQNYLVVSVDTTYPYNDSYSAASAQYHSVRNAFIMGMGGVIVGFIGFFATLVWLMFLSGHTDSLDSEIRLYPIDRIPTELCILIGAVAAAALLIWGKRMGMMVIGLFVNEEHLPFWNKLLRYLIFYGCGILCGFSLLRRYKAGTLWKGSLGKRAAQACKTYRQKASYAAGAAFCYLLFLACNGFMMWLILFLFATRGERISYRIMYYVVLALFAGIDGWVFHRLFRESCQRDMLDQAISTISTGDTGYRLNTEVLTGKERKMGEHINNITSGLDTALQEKVKSERLKADLITNVSHDIKTPLTSIINYVDLLKRQKIQDPKIAAYLEVLDQKSQRLKTLTEDLVEASKASSGNLKLEISDINLVELVQQTNGEFEERFALRRLELIQDLPEEVMIIRADGRRLWRVLENLYTNAFKYAQEGSRVYVDVKEEEDTAVFTMKNISEKPLNISPDELTERFVRGDVARTTEGSGLGLSIARSLTQLQNGQFKIIIDGDLFKAQVIFPVKRREKKAEWLAEEAAAGDEMKEGLDEEQGFAAGSK